MNTPTEAQGGAARKPGVLVAESAGVLGLVQAVLAEAGYAVWPAGSGAEAVAVYRRHSAVIDAALLAVSLDGPGTLAALRALNPRLCCCFLTGGADYAPADLLAQGAFAVVAKPFAVGRLVSVLREAIARG